MGYTFENKPFEWLKEGYDPTTAEAELGLQGGMGLPAAFVNQQWTKTYKAVKEIQDKIEDGTITSCPLIEWEDGNPNDENRQGLFVTLNGDKVKIASSNDDYILGVALGGDRIRTAVACSGMAVVRDDKTCEVGGYCLPDDNGYASRASSGYRVLKRISDDQVMILASVPLIVNKA